MGLLKTTVKLLVCKIIPAMASFLLDKSGVPGMNVQVIACGLLFVIAAQNKLNRMVSIMALAPLDKLVAMLLSTNITAVPVHVAVLRMTTMLENIYIHAVLGTMLFRFPVYPSSISTTTKHGREGQKTGV